MNTGICHTHNEMRILTELKAILFKLQWMGAFHSVQTALPRMGSATLPFTCKTCMFKEGKPSEIPGPLGEVLPEIIKRLHSCSSSGCGRCNLLTLWTALSCAIKFRNPVLSKTSTLGCWCWCCWCSWWCIYNAFGWSSSPLISWHQGSFGNQVICCWEHTISNFNKKKQLILIFLSCTCLSSHPVWIPLIHRFFTNTHKTVTFKVCMIWYACKKAITNNIPAIMTVLPKVALAQSCPSCTSFETGSTKMMPCCSYSLDKRWRKCSADGGFPKTWTQKNCSWLITDI